MAWTEYVGTLTNNTVSLDAQEGRGGLIVSNNSDTVMTLRYGATASAATGIAIPANTAIKLEGNSAPDGSMSLFCAGSDKAYTIYEY